MTSTTVGADARPSAQIAISVETLVYAAISVIAVALRFIRLGQPLLGEHEARQAFAAWNVLTSGAITAGAIESPVAFAAMLISMAVAGASSAAARFGPMLAGLALVASPALFRHHLGRIPTLLSVAALAVSPSIVATSRQVGGFGFAMLSVVLALAALDRYLEMRHSRFIVLLGAALGVALVSDFGTPLALLAMLLGAIFATVTDWEGELEGAGWQRQLRDLPWGLLALSLLTTLILVSTALLSVPRGLGAAADLLARFGRGIVTRPPDVAWLGTALAVYELGLLLFGGAGIWLASQSAEAWRRFLAGWGFAALLIGVLYPGALPGHSLWVIVPLSALAALAVTELLSIEHDAPPWAQWAYAAGIIALFAMTVTGVTQYLRAPHLITIPPNPAPGARPLIVPIDLALVGLWLLMQIVLWFTVASTWGSATAWRGLGLGLIVLSLASAIGQSGALAFNRASSPYELFNPAPAQPGLEALVSTAEDISELATGYPHDAAITVQAPPDRALAWALRDFEHTRFVPYANPTVDSVMVITPAEGADPALGSAYVGQDFVITRRWSPRGMAWADFIHWLLYRSSRTPTSDERVILWVREDIYRLVPAGGELP